MSFDTCELEPTDYSQLVATQVSRLRMGINQNNAISSPWPSVIPGGTFPSNDGVDVRTLVTNRVSPGTSLVRPAFVDNREVCGTTGPTDLIGQTEFTARLNTYRGKGPLVCVKGSFYSVEKSYDEATKALKDNIANLIAVDTRITLHDLSGVKITLNQQAYSTSGFAGLVNGGRNIVGASYPGTTPDGIISFKFLIRLSQYMRETLRLKPFSGGSQGHFIGIGSAEAVEILRSQIDSNILATVKGGYGAGYGYEAGLKQLEAYSFTDVIHRGWLLGIDQEPLRVSGLNGQGQPIFVEPGISVDSDEGKDYIPNPAWESAPYEVFFAVAPESFRRLVPERYVGEGSWSFAAQAVMGELVWSNQIDNECNVWQDFGRHYYQITRAFLPETPHAVIPILFKRCFDGDLFPTCSTTPTSDGELLNT